jgi:ADP-ribosylglycohydrolase
MAVADAVGAPLEFLPVVDTPFSHGRASGNGGGSGGGGGGGDGRQHGFTLDTMAYVGEYNKFGLERGQFTDDASMGLCMADSLLCCGGFNGSDMRTRFHNWWFQG